MSNGVQSAETAYEHKYVFWHNTPQLSLDGIRFMFSIKYWETNIGFENTSNVIYLQLNCLDTGDPLWQSK